MATISVYAYNFIPKNLIGIYSILNIQNGKRYIGQSIDIRKRISAHFRSNRRSKTANSIGAHRTTILKHLAGKLKTVHGYTFIRGGVSSQP